MVDTLNERRTRPAPTFQRLRLAGTIAIAVLPLVVLAAANLGRQVQEGEARVTQDRIALARAAALTVSGFVDTSFATLQTLASTSTLADPTPRPELTALLHRARQTDSPLEAIGLFRPDGWNVAVDGLDQPPLTVNVLDRKYVQRARLTGMRVVSPATIPRTTGVLTVDLVIPVDFASGGRGVVSGSLALTRLDDQLRALPGSDSVQIALIDDAGQVILHPNPDVVRSVTSLRGRPDVEAVLAGQTGSMRSAEDGGVNSLVAYAPVPGYSWGVVVSQPVDTAFALVRRDLLLALGVLGIILALVCVMGWFLGMRLSSAYRQLVAAKVRAEAAQSRAEVAQQRMTFLAEASQVLSSSLNDQTTLEQVARLAVPILGEHCAIDVNAGSSLLAVAEGNVLSVPLVVGGMSIGTITFSRADKGGYAIDEIELAEELAQRVALSVENARLYRAARQAVRDRDEFLSVAAHELKTPITSMRGYAQLAGRRIGTSERLIPHDVRKALNVIETQSSKLARLVEQLLDLSRLEAGKLILTLEEVDLVPLLQMLVERTQLMSDRHVMLFHGPTRAVVTADHLRLEQVVTNLLDNAVKFSPHGGEVLVELSRLDTGEVRLSVQDQGIGIPSDKRWRIFERFYQAHEERLRAGFAGMGLGLHVSQQIVELHGGTIGVEAPAEGGTRMVVMLPATQHPTANSPTNADVVRT
jgi:signal transduction histidine kinase